MVDTSELKQFEKEIDTLVDSALDRNLKQGAHIAGAELQSEARRMVPVDTGALRISIENSALPSGALGVEVGPTQPYGKDIEFGRPPGTFVSAAALSKWAAKRGLNPYVISWSIHKKGSPAQPYLFPAVEAKEDSIIKILVQSVANAFIEIFK